MNFFYKKAVPIQDDLKEHLENNPDQYKQMEQIDMDSFSKYEGGFGQDAEDIMDDFQQPGAGGVGLTDEAGNIVGYVYGYNMTGDEIPNISKKTTNEELVNQYGVKLFKPVPEGFYKQFLNLE